MSENPLKNKKTFGMLIMALALVLVAVILVIVIVASSGSNDTTPDSTPEITPEVTTSEDPDTTTAPDTTDNTPASSTPVTTLKPVAPIDPTLTETVGKADESGKITVNKNEAANGLLINVNADNPYAYDVENRFLGDNTTKKSDVEAAGYYRLSENDLMKLYATNGGQFLKKEAMEALVKMLSAFNAVSGQNSPFTLAAYSKDRPLTNTLVTGNVFWIKIKADGDYNFDYSAFKVTVDGEAMTYEEWFEANCAKFGFIYEGMVGTMNGEFRYVGTIHAAGIQAAGSIAAYTEAVKNGSVTTATAQDGSKWNLSYHTLTEDTAEITVGAKATYHITGDNKGGIIVAVLVTE